MSSNKILNGRDAIMDYIGISSLPLFYDFIRRGMPCLKINNRIYAHADNLDNFFKAITNKKPPKDIAEAE